MAGTENTQTNKNPESTASKRAALFKRREGLFRKAHELSVLCQADVGVITISGDGSVKEFASCSMENLITRYREKWNLMNMSHLSSPEEPKEDVSKEAEGVAGRSPENRNFLGKDLECMNLRELFVLEGQLSKGLFCIKDRKIQLLTGELQESRLKAQDVSQKNQNLLREVEEIQCLGPVYYPTPLAVRFPEREGDTNTEFLPSTSFAEGPETEDNSQNADGASLYSSSFAVPMAIDYLLPVQHSVVPADRDTLPTTSYAAQPGVDTGLGLSLFPPSSGDCGETSEWNFVRSR